MDHSSNLAAFLDRFRPETANAAAAARRLPEYFQQVEEIY